MSSDPSARMLRLLALLQTRREWPGAELAARLEVTGRTARRDIDRLRELGYPVEGNVGQAGGYRLAPGVKLPPLLLDDDEAVALAVALITASAGVTGMPETALRALAKLQPILPERLRDRIASVRHSTVPTATPAGPRVDPDILATLAGACRDHEIIGFHYRTRHSTTSDRRVEPHHLVAAFGRWFLIAYDTRAHGWCTFRADRITQPLHTRHHFPDRDLPAADPVTFLSQHIAAAPYRYTARVTVHAPAQRVRERTGALPERVQQLDEDTCVVTISDDSLDHIVGHLVALGSDFTLDSAPPELHERLKALADRLTRATHDGTPAAHSG